MARVGPILQLWTQDPHFAVRPSSHGIHPRLNWAVDSILMQWAEGGSLDDYIVARLGRPTQPTHHSSTQEDDPSSDIHSRSARIRAFRAMQRATPSEKPALRAKLINNDGNSWTAVHLLSAEEVLGIFGGVAAGLGFLVRIICLPNQIVRC